MRNKRLDILKSAIRKEHGKSALGMASRVRDIRRISTGSLALDRALGGGIPAGKITLLRGSESSGKTATAYRALGIAQNLCANCLRPVENLEFKEEIDDDGEVVVVASGNCDCYQKGLMETVQYPEEKIPDYKRRIKELEENSYEEFRAALIDVEHVFSPKWASRLGVDGSRLLYLRPDTAEQTIDLYDDLLRTGAVHMIVLDSIAALAPREEIEKSAYEQQQALMARLMGKFTRREVSAANFIATHYRSFPTRIWINQEREKIGISYGDNTVMPAGNAQKFIGSAIVKMWPSKWERETQDSELKADFQSEIGIKVRINFKTLKNRTAPAFQTGSYTLVVSGEDAGKIDELKYFLAMAEKFGLFTTVEDGKKKSWMVGDEEYTKKSDAIDRMMESAVYGEMRSLILDRMLGVNK
jgi:RecA/RadA recombinase